MRARLHSPFIVLLLVITQPAWSETSTRTLCVDGERPVFACTTGKKLASVCAGTNYVQYRFGTRARTEIQLPSALDSPAIAYRESTFNTGFASYLRFISGKYRYYIFAASAPGSATDSPEKYRRDEPTGIMVMKGDRRIVTLSCKDRPSLALFNEAFLGKIVSLQNADQDIDPYEVAFGLSSRGDR